MKPSISQKLVKWVPHCQKASFSLLLAGGIALHWPVYVVLSAYYLHIDLQVSTVPANFQWTYAVLYL